MSLGVAAVAEQLEVLQVVGAAVCERPAVVNLELLRRAAADAGSVPFVNAAPDLAPLPAVRHPASPLPVVVPAGADGTAGAFGAAATAEAAGGWSHATQPFRREVWRNLDGRIDQPSGPGSSEGAGLSHLGTGDESAFRRSLRDCAEALLGRRNVSGLVSLVAATPFREVVLRLPQPAAAIRSSLHAPASDVAP